MSRPRGRRLLAVLLACAHGRIATFPGVRVVRGARAAARLPGARGRTFVLQVTNGDGVCFPAALEQRRARLVAARMR